MKRNKVKEEEIVNGLIKSKIRPVEVIDEARQLFNKDNFTQEEVDHLYKFTMAKFRHNYRLASIILILLVLTFIGIFAAMTITSSKVIAVLGMFSIIKCAQLIVSIMFYLDSTLPYNENQCRVVDNWLPILAMYLLLNLMEEGVESAQS